MKTLALAAILALAGASGAFARTYHGEYTASFFIDPGSNPGSIICLNLTPSAGIAGIANSGTFVDENGFGITGQYLLDGKSFHLVALGTAFGDNIDAIGKPVRATVTGVFDDLFSTYSPEVTGGQFAAQVANVGTFTLTPGCTDAARQTHSTHHTTTY
jgi:hypothetical protein